MKLLLMALLSVEKSQVNDQYHYLHNKNDAKKKVTLFDTNNAMMACWLDWANS
jgi:hypothetical protein